MNNSLDDIDFNEMGRLCLGHSVRRTANLLTRHFNRYLAPLGLEITQAQLMAVIASGDDLSSSDIARYLGIDRSDPCPQFETIRGRRLDRTAQARRPKGNTTPYREGRHSDRKSSCCLGTGPARPDTRTRRRNRGCHSRSLIEPEKNRSGTRNRCQTACHAARRGVFLNNRIPKNHSF